MPSHPTRTTPPAFSALDPSKKSILERVAEYNDPTCIKLKELISIVEELASDLSFHAECQEYVDAQNNARAYRRASKSLEEMIPIIQIVASEITFQELREEHDPLEFL